MKKQNENAKSIEKENKIEKNQPVINQIQKVDPPMQLENREQNSSQQKEEVSDKFMLAIGFANKLLTNVIELTKRNAEIKRLKIRQLEASQTNKSETVSILNVFTVEKPKLNETNLKRKLDENTAADGKRARQEENSEEINNIIKQNFEILRKSLNDTICK